MGENSSQLGHFGVIRSPVFSKEHVAFVQTDDSDAGVPRRLGEDGTPLLVVEGLRAGTYNVNFAPLHRPSDGFTGLFAADEGCIEAHIVRRLDSGLEQGGEWLDDQGDDTTVIWEPVVSIETQLVQ